MSRLERLIQELCPNGVEYKTLGEIATAIYRGSGITREQITTNGTPCVRYGEIYTTYGIWFDKCVSYTNEEKIASKKYFEHGDILFAITGESIEEIAKSCAYTGNERCLAGGDVVVLKHRQNPKYLSYALSTTQAQSQKSRGKVKSKVVHSNVPSISEILIPVPPMEIQAEIVRILDSFTELNAELAEKLNAELNARKKQYEYYRDSLMAFNNASGVRSKKLEELIARYCHDKVPFLTLNNCVEQVTNIKWSDTNDKHYKYIDLSSVNRNLCTITETQIINAVNAPSRAQQIVKTGDVLLGTTRPMLKRYCLISPEFNGHICSTGFCVLRAKKDVIMQKWLYYQISSTSFFAHVAKFQKGTSYPSISDYNVKSYKIPVPPMEIQAKIVSILERFDALCSDISSVLPAEIEARRKQYEYYRDRLLDFKEARP